MTSHSRIIEAAEVASERVKEFHCHWRSKSAGCLPARQAIDPVEIPRLLPHLLITDIERDPLRVRYRLVGTRVVEASGADFTNRYLDECSFAAQPILTECYGRLVDTRAPVFAHYEWNKKDWHKPRGRIRASETGFFS
jgi:hypothetical protein